MKQCTPESIVEYYFFAKRQAEENRIRENLAATKIQACYRRYSQNKVYLTIRNATCNIQRVYRGYKYGRSLIKQLLAEKTRKEKELLLDYCATQIQKVFRGYRFRKNVHNYYARKQYLQSVYRKGQEIQHYIERWKQLQHAISLEEKEIKELEEFERTTANMHHLLSTKTIPGVLKKFGEVVSQKTIYGMPIEDHLRDTSRLAYLKK